MASPLTVRLDAKTRQRLARIARRRNISTSDLVREAIEAWAGQHELVTCPFEKIADLVGIVHGGDPLRSQAAGRRFTKALKERAAKRRGIRR